MSSEKLRLVGLGDALRYSILYELPILLEEGMDEAEHFYACLSYLALHEYMDSDSLNEIYKCVTIGIPGYEGMREEVDYVTKIIFRKLMGRIQFDNIESLGTQLNQIDIPEWYFDISNQLFGACMRNAFLLGGYFYYIDNSVEEKAFTKIKVKYLELGERLDRSHQKDVLGRGYDVIYGCDKKSRRVYVGVENQEDFCYCYDVVKDHFVLLRNRFLTIYNEMVFVITRDNYLAYLSGDEVCKMKEYRNEECYIPRGKGFLVVPKDMRKTVFYPYFITCKGEILPAEAKECRRLIWDEVMKIAEDGAERILRRDNVKPVRPVPEVLSVHSILNGLQKKMSDEECCTNDKYIFFETIMDIVGKYIGKDVDITQFLYALYEFSHMVGKLYETFPSEEVYWCFKDVDTPGGENERLKKAVKALEVKDLIPLARNEITLHEEKGKPMGMIGEFIWEGFGAITTYACKKSDGIIIGDQIMMDIDLCGFDGIVTYDCRMNVYRVTSVRELTPREKFQIKYEYELPYDRVEYIVHSPSKEKDEVETNKLEGNEFTPFYEETFSGEALEDDIDFGDIFDPFS